MVPIEKVHSNEVKREIKMADLEVVEACGM